MAKRVSLTEAIKINIEIDPRDIEGFHSESHNNTSKRKEISVDGGKFEEYVRVLANESIIAEPLKEASREIHRMVYDILEDVSLREDKRMINTAQSHAINKVMKEWRAFVREISDFEKRFK